MRLKKGVILLSLLAILFISACTTTTTSYGVDGAYSCFGDDEKMITAEFAEFAPVSSEASPYAPGEDIDVEIVLKNKLTRDIPEGNVKIRLTGDAAIDSIFSGAQVVSAESLFGIDSETCREEDIEVELGPIVYQGDVTTKVSREISGLYCYEEPVVVRGFLYFTANEDEIGTTLPTDANPPSSVQVIEIEQNPVNVATDGERAEMRFKIHLENVGEGTIVEDLNECFEFREAGFREEFKITVDAGYPVDCPESVKLSRDERTDVITCKVTGIDTANLGPTPSELKITLHDFAYEDVIESTTIWIEP
jgi:hypothetical protein